VVADENGSRQVEEKAASKGFRTVSADEVGVHHSEINLLALGAFPRQFASAGQRSRFAVYAEAHAALNRIAVIVVSRDARM
jgi:hypothetical protein